MFLCHEAVICIIVRNEELYIDEWIAFHKLIGFDHVYLYDNGSTDNTSLLAKEWGNFVTVIPWPSRPGERMQFTAYKHFLVNFRKFVNWVMFLDADEFLNLKTATGIKAFLDERKDFSAIGINWRLFGDNGLIQYDSRPVIRRFTAASAYNFDANRHIKTIVKCSAILELAVHSPILQPGHSLVSPSGVPLRVVGDILPNHVEHIHAQVNHYFTKSYSEWTVKRKRGRATVAIDSPERYRNDEVFYWHNQNDEVDASLLRFEQGIIEQLKIKNAQKIKNLFFLQKLRLHQ